MAETAARLVGRPAAGSGWTGSVLCAPGLLELLRDCIELLLSAGDLDYDLVRQADDALVGPADFAVFDTNLILQSE